MPNDLTQLEFAELVEEQAAKDAAQENLQRLHPELFIKTKVPFSVKALATPVHGIVTTGKGIYDLMKNLPSTTKRINAAVRTDQLGYYPAQEALGLASLADIGRPAPEGSLGIIKGIGRDGSDIRKIMAQEFRARGKPFDPKAIKAIRDYTKHYNDVFVDPVTNIPRSPAAELRVKHLIDEVARGPWLHGRRTYPHIGATFEEIKDRIRTGNLGEPHGLSLTADVSTARTFAKPKKAVDAALSRARANAQNALEYFDRSIDKITSDRFPSQIADIARAYIKSEMFYGHGSGWPRIQYLNLPVRAQLKALVAEHGPKLATSVKEMTYWDSVANKLRAKPKAFARVLPQFSGLPTEKILPAWKGPGTEYAQAILKDVYVKALRKQSHLWNPISRHSNTKQLSNTWRGKVNVTQLNGDITRELKSQGYEALLYSPSRYQEWELRMLGEGENVMMLDKRITNEPVMNRMFGFEEERIRERTASQPVSKHRKRLRNWEESTHTYPSSLRDIYADIDTSTLTQGPESAALQALKETTK